MSKKKWSRNCEDVANIEHKLDVGDLSKSIVFIWDVVRINKA